MNWLRDSYNIIIDTYVYEFMIKQGFIDSRSEMPRDYLIGDGIIEIGDYYFNQHEIMYDIDNGVPVGKILEYYDYNLSHVQNGYHTINYVTYIRGFRHKERGWFDEAVYRTKRWIRNIYGSFKFKLYYIFTKEGRMFKKRFEDEIVKGQNFSGGF